MVRIRNLKGGVFYRPVDTPAGKKGWCADIYYEEFIPKRNNKGNKDNRQSMRINWTAREIHLGPKKEKELKQMYEEKYSELSELLKKDM